MIRFTCPKCEHRIKAPGGLTGRKGKCPKCGHPVIVPAAEEGLAKGNSTAHASTGNSSALVVPHVDVNEAFGGDPRIRPCPHCGGAVLRDAATCVHCRRSLDEAHVSDPETGGVTPNLDAVPIRGATRNKHFAWTAVFSVVGGLAAAVLLTVFLLFRASRGHLEPRGYFYANKLGLGTSYMAYRVVPQHVVFCIVAVDVPCRQFAVNAGYEIDPRRFTLVLPDGSGTTGAVITLWNTEKQQHGCQTWGPILGLYQTDDVHGSDAFVSTRESGFEPVAKDVVRPMIPVAIGFVLPDGEHRPPLAIQLDGGREIRIPSQMSEVSEAIASYDPGLPRPSGQKFFAFPRTAYATQLYEDSYRRLFTCHYPCGWTVQESRETRDRWVKFVGTEAEIGVRISMDQGKRLPDAQVVKMLESESRRLFREEQGTITPGKATDGSSYSFVYRQNRPAACIGVVMGYFDRRVHTLMLKTANNSLLDKWSSEFNAFLATYHALTPDRKN